MNHCLKYRLEILDFNLYEVRKDYISSIIDVKCFFTLQDVWSHLGFKLKKERNGYAGVKGNFGYTLIRIN